MLTRGMTLLQVGKHFGASYGAVWRLVRRERRAQSQTQMAREEWQEGGGR